MKIVLIDPKGVWEGLNNGLASIAANIRNEHKVTVLDFVNRSGSFEKRLEAVRDADVVGISMKSFTLTEGIMVAQKVRAINQSAKIIAGGPHVIVDGYNLMKENPVFDMAVRGEAEVTFKQLAEGKPSSEIGGLIYRDGNEIKQNPQFGWIANLDELPFPCYDDFDSINVDGKMQKIDVWPLVTSRGCPYTCTYCFPKGTLIHTDKGLKNIEELRNFEGVSALSHSGNWVPIIHFFERNYNGKLVKIKAHKLPPIKTTKNHKFHVLRNGIKTELRAEEIEVGDYLAVQMPKTASKEFIDVAELIGGHNLIYEYSRKVPYDKVKIAVELNKSGLSTRKIAKETGLSKSFVHTVINNNFEEKKYVENNLEVEDELIGFRLSKKIPRNLRITKDLCRLFGYYLAEGSVSKSSKRPNSWTVSWSFNKNENAYIKDVKKLAETIFGLKTFIVNQDNVTRVCLSNPIAAMFFWSLFGKASDNKYIADFILSLDKEFLEELLKGWILGDGGIVNYDGKKMIKASTVSDSLAYQFMIISYKIGLSPSLQKNMTKDSFIGNRKIKNKGYNYHLNFKYRKDVKHLLNTIFGIETEISNELNSKEIRDENIIFFPVAEISEEDFSGLVYNIEVEKDHTYTANGFLVNNCNVPVVIGRKFRTRSGKNIADELRYAKEKYGSGEFKVLDDNFTLLMDRAKDICRLFIDEKLGMKWTCPNGIRADRLDEELCKLMHDAGCYSISIGVESGDAEVFDKIKKGEKLADVERGIRLAQQAGIQVHGFFIIGLLGSTYEADKRSVEFAKRVGISASWGILVPYPGTEVWEQIKQDKNARILRDWKEGFHIGARPKPVFDTVDYTAEERVKMYYHANMATIKKKDIPRAAKMVIKGLIAGK